MTLDTAVPVILRPSHVHSAFARGKARRCSLAVIALLCALSNGAWRVDAAEALPSPAPTAEVLVADAVPAGLQWDQAEPPPQPSLVSRWWFWTAVGAVAVATAAVIGLSSRGSAPPVSHLGNQVFAP